MSGWSIPPREFVGEAEREADAWVRSFALECQRIAVQLCLVDTGRLRASIMVSIGAPDPSLMPPEAGMGASGDAGNGAAATRFATEQALGAVADYTLGATIVIQSNLSYAAPREAEDQFFARAADFVAANL